MSSSAIPLSIRRAVFERDGGRCRYCRLSQCGQAATFHINHILPRSAGGKTALDNLVLQCPYCSLHKSNKLGGVDPLSNQLIAFFHPLREAWREHFLAMPDGNLVGTTPQGVVTVIELRMNDPLPRLARSLQKLTGLLDD